MMMHHIVVKILAPRSNFILGEAMMATSGSYTICRRPGPGFPGSAPFLKELDAAAIPAPRSHEGTTLRASSPQELPNRFQPRKTKRGPGRWDDGIYGPRRSDCDWETKSTTDRARSNSAQFTLREGHTLVAESRGERDQTLPLVKTAETLTLCCSKR